MTLKDRERSTTKEQNRTDLVEKQNWENVIRSTHMIVETEKKKRGLRLC